MVEVVPLSLEIGSVGFSAFKFDSGPSLPQIPIKHFLEEVFRMEAADWSEVPTFGISQE